MLQMSCLHWDASYTGRFRWVVAMITILAPAPAHTVQLMFFFFFFLILLLVVLICRPPQADWRSLSLWSQSAGFQLLCPGKFPCRYAGKNQVSPLAAPNPRSTPLWEAVDKRSLESHPAELRPAPLCSQPTLWGCCSTICGLLRWLLRW